MTAGSTYGRIFISIMLVLLIIIHIYWVVSEPPEHLFGDGPEYVLMTLNFVISSAFKLEKETVDYFNVSIARPLKVSKIEAKTQDGKIVSLENFSGFYKDRFGRYHCYHFWLYSLFVYPIYGFLDAASPFTPKPLLSFSIFNLLLFILVLIAVSRRFRGSLTGLIIIYISIIFSPLEGYLIWQHPEIFSFALTSLAFLESYRWGKFLAPVYLGLAATQNQPLLMAFPLLYFIQSKLSTKAMDSPNQINKKMIVCFYTVGVFIGISPILYYLYYFNTPNLIVETGSASLKMVSFRRLADFYIDPAVGMIWHYPAVLFFILFFKPRKTAYWAVSATSVIMASASCATLNFNPGMIGLRYLSWHIPIFYPFLVRIFRNISFKSIRFWLGSILFGMIASNFIQLPGNPHLEKFNPRRRFESNYNYMAFLRWIPVFYQPTPEIFAENILHREIKYDEKPGPLLFKVSNPIWGTGFSPGCMYQLLLFKPQVAADGTFSLALDSEESRSLSTGGLFPELYREKSISRTGDVYIHEYDLSEMKWKGGEYRYLYIETDSEFLDFSPDQRSCCSLSVNKDKGLSYLKLAKYQKTPPVDIYLLIFSRGKFCGYMPESGQWVATDDYGLMEPFRRRMTGYLLDKFDIKRIINVDYLNRFTECVFVAVAVKAGKDVMHEDDWFGLPFTVSLKF